MANIRVDGYACYVYPSGQSVVPATDLIPQSQPDIFVEMCIELSTCTGGSDLSYGSVISEHGDSRLMTFDELVNPEEESSVIHAMISSLYPRLDTCPEMWQSINRNINQYCTRDMIRARDDTQAWTVYITIDESMDEDEDEDEDEEVEEDDSEEVMLMVWRNIDGYVKTVKIDEKTELTCSICLDSLTAGTEGDQLPCHHMYHGTCIRKWLSKSRLCPMCRFELRA